MNRQDQGHKFTTSEKLYTNKLDVKLNLNGPNLNLNGSHYFSDVAYFFDDVFHDDELVLQLIKTWFTSLCSSLA